MNSTPDSTNRSPNSNEAIRKRLYRARKTTVNGIETNIRGLERERGKINKRKIRARIKNGQSSKMEEEEVTVGLKEPGFLDLPTNRKEAVGEI